MKKVLMNQTIAWSHLVVGLLVSAAIGCAEAEKQPLPVPAGGAVTYNGKPLEGAQVSFLSTDTRRGRTASAVTDKQGEFQLETFPSPGQKAAGALPGTYQVAIRKREPNGPAGGAERNAAPGLAAPGTAAKGPSTPPPPSETPGPPAADKTGSSDTKTSAPSEAEAPKGPTAAPSARPPSASRGGAGAGGMPAKPPDVKEGKSLIPERYGNPEESGLTAVVKPEGNEPFQFDLTDE